LLSDAALALPHGCPTFTHQEINIMRSQTAGTVGFIGLGSMGGGMAHRLLAQGHDVRVWNRTREKAEDLAAAGAIVAQTPRDAAIGADVVLLSVADGRALRTVTEGPDGAFAGLGPGAVLVNTSTVHPEQVRAFATRPETIGRRVVDAGVLGNADHAREGQLRIYAGGDADAVERCRPVLDDLAKEIVHIGPLGAGMELKLVLNLVMGLEMQALAEAAAFGVARGLDRAQVLQAIAGSGFSSPVMSFKARRMIAQRFGDADFRLTLMAKDLGLVADGAAELGLSLPMTAAACELHNAAVAAGLGELDCAAIVAQVAA
jgi:3-hydroxyisobutyrate dehydrogenase